MSAQPQWDRFQKYACPIEPLNFSLDVSRLSFSDEWVASMQPAMTKAFVAMASLEKGAIANPDEQRRVGHYWLRAPQLAPVEEGAHIRAALTAVKAFAAKVHDGRIAPPAGGKFTKLLIVGIGGSALGPQLTADALGQPGDPLQAYFFDNTDPDGFDRVFAQLGSSLGQTLVVVISKSGGTQETRNGMLEAQAAFGRAGLDFSKHAVAVTGTGSELEKIAEGWLAQFPMWDWVGGRTSVTSAVGLLPMALQGHDLDAFLEGARLADAATRVPETLKNPAALLALAWHFGGEGRGARDLVVLPYKDRLVLLSRYLQQLVMESLGKERDLDGQLVHQGLSVYGNKGSTDQHAYVQQLREGVPNFFTLFVEVLKDRDGASIEVEPRTTSGDYLLGFLLGTRAALAEKGRESITLTVPDVSAKTLGALIALFERAVGLYSSLINVNAYHQPGVEAGKRAASAVLLLQSKVLAALTSQPQSAVQLANTLAAEPQTVFELLRHLAFNGRVMATSVSSPAEARFFKEVK